MAAEYVRAGKGRGRPPGALNARTTGNIVKMAITVTPVIYRSITTLADSAGVSAAEMHRRLLFAQLTAMEMVMSDVDENFIPVINQPEGEGK